MCTEFRRVDSRGQLRVVARYQPVVRRADINHIEGGRIAQQGITDSHGVIADAVDDFQNFR